MFPVFLDVKKLKILLVGQGEPARKRLKQLREFGAENITYYDKLVSTEALLQANVVLIAGLEQQDAHRIADVARGMGKLVNVEDDIPYCDFFYASTLKRGDLTIAVGTNGKSPTLARSIRAFLTGVFDERWGEWLERLGNARDEWREAGDDMETVGKKTEAMIVEHRMQPLAGFLQPEKE